MKRFKKIVLLLLLIVMIIIGSLFSLTPKGSVKFAAIRHGHPIRGLTSEITEIENTEEQFKLYTFYYLDPTPVGTTGPYGYWKTTKIAIFYWSSFFGAF